jgi:diguanylate cyclase (GGDEF)-like protein
VLGGALLLISGEALNGVRLTMASEPGGDLMSSGLLPIILTSAHYSRVPLGAALLGLIVWFASPRSLRRGAAKSPTGLQDDSSQAPGGDGSGDVAPAPAQPQSKTRTFSLDAFESPPAPLPTSNQLGELLQSVVYFVSRNFRAYSALGFIYEPQRQSFVLNSFHTRSTAIIPECVIGLGQGIVGRIGVDGRSFLSGDLSVYGMHPTYYSRNEMINSILVMPVVSDQGELLGALAIDSKDKNAFTEDAKETLRRFSLFAAALISNVRMRLFQELAIRRFQIFYEASQRFVTTLEQRALFDTVVATAGQLISADRIVAASFDGASGEILIERVVGGGAQLQDGQRFPLNAGLYSFAIQKRKTVLIDDLNRYGGKYFRMTPADATASELRALLILPLIDDEARCIGILSLESAIPGHFTPQSEHLLATLAGNASVALLRALLYRRMEVMATTDGLTGLSNHRHFQELLAREIDRSKRYGPPLSLLLLDIDHFKAFNDTYGHPVGDLVLKEVAACIRGAIRTTDYAARYGGEEFAVIMPETQLENCAITPERIRAAIENHVVDSMGKPLRVKVSVGVATFPIQATTPQQLIACADKALYFSKENGRNRVSVYTDRMGPAEHQ